MIFTIVPTVSFAPYIVLETASFKTVVGCPRGCSSVWNTFNKLLPKALHDVVIVSVWEAVSVS